LTNLQLFAACVAIWGSTWIAITFQLGSVAPEASVFYRFLLASLLLFGWCLARGLPLRFARRQHLWMAVQGAFMFSVSYVAVYYAEQNVVSGLVAVGFSASPLLNMVGMRLIFGSPMTARVAVGALLGIAGITLVFWPEFSHLRADGRVALGAAFTVAAVVLSALGNMAAHRNHDAGLPIWQSMAWGMLYGALVTLAIALALGRPLAFEATPAYVLSLVYLAVFGSVLAFGGFLTLLGRVGPARAGYIGVMVPIVALAISSVFEGYRWELLALAGVAVSVAGNVIILRRAGA
jgi:drug/metabolite transporter (DMT)-like permease